MQRKISTILIFAITVVVLAISIAAVESTLFTVDAYAAIETDSKHIIDASDNIESEPAISEEDIRSGGVGGTNIKKNKEPTFTPEQLKVVGAMVVATAIALAGMNYVYTKNRNIRN